MASKLIYSPDNPLFNAAKGAVFNVAGKVALILCVYSICS